MTRPVKNPFTGRRMVPFGLRLDRPGGGFAGVLLAIVEPRYLEAFYDSIETGASGFVTTLHRDGWIVARSPFDEAIVARDWSQAPMFRKHLPAARAGTVRQVVVTSGVESMFAYRALEEYPLVVSAEVSLTGALASWRARALRDGMILLAVLSAIAAATWQLLRHLAWREAASAELAQGRAKFEHLTAIATDSYWELDEELRFTYISPGIADKSGLTSYRAYYGKQRSELPFVDLNDAKWDTYRDALAARRPFRDFETGLVNDAGETRWFLIGGDPVFDPTGAFRGYRGVSLDITARRRAEEHRRAQTEALEALSGRLVEAQEEERTRIARELHDELGQSLTAAKIRLQAAPASSGPEVVALLDQAIAQTRNLSLDLYPPHLDDLGLAMALRAHIERHFPDGAPEVRLEEPLPLPALPGEVALSAFRIAQEALTNAVRHGGAVSVRMSVRTETGALIVEVADDGRGFDPAMARGRALHGSSLGLLNMEERARQCGGALAIRSAPGAGTTVQARLPL